MNKLVITLITLAALLMPAEVNAAQYGQGTVLGKGGEEIVHEPKDTGIRENLPFIGASMLFASGVLLFLSKRERKILRVLN